MHEPPPLSPPPAPEPALQTAARLLAEGRPDAAVERLRALLAGAPMYAAAHVLHATALEAAGQRAEALEAWSHAALLVPRSPLVRRERQRLAGPFAPEPTPEPPAPVSRDAPAPEAALEPEPPTDTETPATLEVEFDVPSIEGFPLDSLAAHFETDTPLFEDDDEPDAETLPPPPENPEATHAEAAGAFVPDWGDLPPPSAPLLPPGTDPVPAPPVPSPDPEPDDWRVLDVTEDRPDTPVPADVPGLTFEHPFAPPLPPPPVAEPRVANAVPTEPAARPAPEAGDDLDALISRLEHAPRIRPDPAFEGPAVRPDESGVDEMVSETLAKIYAAQHRYVEAAVMYEKLAAREPSQADVMLRRAAELRERR